MLFSLPNLGPNWSDAVPCFLERKGFSEKIDGPNGLATSIAPHSLVGHASACHASEARPICASTACTNARPRFSKPAWISDCGTRLASYRGRLACGRPPSGGAPAFPLLPVEDIAADLAGTAGLHCEHLEHFVAVVIDDLHRDFLRLRRIEWATRCAV